jgi:hypothetical protein
MLRVNVLTLSNFPDVIAKSRFLRMAGLILQLSLNSFWARLSRSSPAADEPL